ncbi:MAG: MiaB/RimO family radical SAM methylthiotransferase, partial [Thiotrichales bacterium]|nr:MiaB/RimO family radical SAM methylthiotransferase [Thiotrichales bacterium]
HEIEGIDLLVSNRDKDQLVEISTRMLDLPTMPSTATIPGENAIFTRNRSRAFIKIQDGCRYRCTFCIVTVARGEERSISPAAIIDCINSAHEQGIREIVLTGVHAGGYGSDINTSLTGLIKQVLQETDIHRIRMGSVEPWDLPDEFLSLYENKRFMPHLHLPLQSGSDSVLRRMARRCKTKAFADLVNRLRNRVPGFNVTTDIIVGFPGETENEWQETVDFVQSIGFSDMHIFSYSPRLGTKAAGMDGQVSANVTRSRSRQLHELAQQMKQNALRANIGKTFEVLWESGVDREEEKEIYYGYAPGYQRVTTAVTKGTRLKHQVKSATMTGLSPCGSMLSAEIRNKRHG